MQQIDLTILSGALFSEDNKYRYALWRRWSTTRPILGLIGLNPSKAGAIKNDPTIIRNIVRADREGYGGMIMTNKYGLISTDPKALLDNLEAIGELTDYYIKQMVSLSSAQLCMWGSFLPDKSRSDAVYKMLVNPYCLGLNADGEPKHSLYVSYDTNMMSYGRCGLGIVQC